MLVLNRKVSPVAAYFPAAHLERFGIANIARIYFLKLARVPSCPAK
jgi:hypothetical protein